MINVLKWSTVKFFWSVCQSIRRSVSQTVVQSVSKPDTLLSVLLSISVSLPPLKRSCDLDLTFIPALAHANATAEKSIKGQAPIARSTVIVNVYDCCIITKEISFPLRC